MMTSQVKKSLHEYALEHEKKVMALAQTVYEEDLVPFLKSKGYIFRAGMGGWAVWNEKGYMVHRDDLPHHLYNKLTLDAQVADDDLGSLMPDYPQS